MNHDAHLEAFLDALLIVNEHALEPVTEPTGKPAHFTIGCIYPEAFAALTAGAEPCAMLSECLFSPHTSSAEIEATVRFLQPLAREVGRLATPVSAWPQRHVPMIDWRPSLVINGVRYDSGRETTEREISASVQLHGDPAFVPFLFPGTRTLDPIRDEAGNVVAVIAHQQPAIAGTIELTAEPAGAGGAFRLSLRIVNRSGVSAAEGRDAESVLPRTFVSTHAILHAHGADFISRSSPPAEYVTATAACRNVGAWPVLVGDDPAAECDTMLVAPMSLPDYPRLALESAGVFDEGAPFANARTRMAAEQRAPLPT